jgi:hypothetical protein
MSNDVQVFGMTKDAIQEQYINSITARFSGLEMVVAGILSDCQEELAIQAKDNWRDQNKDPRAERIRKQLNVAKFILFELINQREGIE